MGPFRLDAARAVLTLDGEPLPLGPRVVATLGALVERAGEVVTKDELLDLVWRDADVNESNVAQSVYTLRKTFREHGLEGAIATVPRRGYRFTGPVEVLAPDPPPFVVPPVAAMPAARRPWFARAWFAAAAVVLACAAVAIPAASRHPSAPALSSHGAEHYRLGRYFWNQRNAQALAKSASLFDAVIREDPRNPLGYSGLADTNLMIADYERDRVRPKTYYARARALVALALRLDPLSAAARTSHAMVLYTVDHRVADAESEFRRAIALDPGYAVAHHWYGIMLFERNRLAEASRELRSATTLDPTTPATGVWLATAAYYSRAYADAIAYEQRALELDPARFDALRTLGLAYELSGDLPRAISAFERLRRLRRDDAHGLLAEAYARAGRQREAQAALRSALRVAPRDGDTIFAMLALGERKRALDVLGAMCRQQPPQPGEVDDPRFAVHGIRPCG